MAMTDPDIVATNIVEIIASASAVASPAPPDAHAVWAAIVTEIQAMVKSASVTIKTTDAALQRDPAGMNDDTLGPAADRTLTDCIT